MRSLARLGRVAAYAHVQPMQTRIQSPQRLTTKCLQHPFWSSRAPHIRYLSGGSRFEISRFSADSAGEKSVEDQISSLQVSVRSLRNEGRFAEAKNDALQCLDLIEGAFGRDHPVYASGANNLGIICRDLGEFEEAIEYYIQAFQTYQSVVGDDHPSTAIAMHNLANTYKLFSEQTRGMERHQLLLQAKELFQDTLAVRQKILGKGHPETGSTMQNLGRVLSLLENGEDARRHVLQGAKVIEAALGDKHPQVAIGKQ